MNVRSAKLLAAAALSASAAFGTQVTVSLGSNPFPNGTAAPYVGTIGGVTTTIYCDDAFDSVSSNESWTATVLTLNNLNAGDYTTTRFGSSAGSLAAATTLYEKIAYLALQFTSNPSADWAAIQTALWEVADPGVSPIGTSGPTSSAYWKSLDNTNYATVAALASRIEILTPISGTQSKGGLPQEFIVITAASPEPGTYALFGVGLILLSIGTFRRRGKKSE